MSSRVIALPQVEGALVWGGPLMILYEDEQRRLEEICDRLLRDIQALAVFFIDPEGQLIARVGRHDEDDTAALSSLVAGTVAATTRLAQLLGQSDFPTHYHEGPREHLYIAKVTEGLILVVLFDERASLGLVRLRVRKTRLAVEVVYDSMVSKATRGRKFDPFVDITDEEVDRFFGDGF